MRRRLLVSVAALAAALLAPPAALAAGQPVITSPATPTSATNVAPSLTWLDVPDATLGYHVRRADGDCASNPVLFITPTGGDIPAGVHTFADNSPLPAQGTYCYLVQSDDGLTVDSLPVTITYDTTAPGGSLTSPANGATHTTPVHVEASASDAGSGVASVTFEAKPTGFPTWSQIGLATIAPYDVNWTPVTDGTYDIRAVIVDNAGNPTTVSVLNVVVDGTDPTGSVTAPAAGAILHGAVNALTTNAADATSGVSSVRYERSNGAGWTTIQTTGTPPYTGNWNTTGLDGSFDVRAVVTDNATNEFMTASVAVTVDNTAPTVSVTAPAASAVVHGATVVVSANASDVGGSGVTGVSFEVQLGAGAWTPIGSDAGSPYSVSWDTTTATPDGLYNVRAIATDGATLATTSAAITGVRVDNTAPTVSVTAPAASAVVRGASVVVSANAADAGSGVTGVSFEVQLGAGAWTPVGSDSGSPYSVSWDTTTATPDGLYNVRAIATDAATLATISTAITGVRVDNTLPTVTLGGASGGASVHSAVALTATADGTGSAVQSVAFGYRLGSVGGFTTILPVDTTFPYSASFNAAADGVYDFQALVTDVAGNTFTHAIAGVLVDDTPPPAPAKPTGLTPVSAAPTITFVPVIDPLSGGVRSGVEHYNVYRNGGVTPINVAPIAAGGPYTWSDVAGQSTSPAAVSNVTYSYTVVAVDGAGNLSPASPALGIYLDTTAASAPTGVTALATPTNQRPQVSWVAPTAPGFTHYKVYRAGVEVGDVSGTVFTDLSAGDGTYTYQVVAVDAGNVTFGIASAPVVITFDTTPPAAPGGLSAAAALDGSIAIGWSAAGDGAGSGVARYVVRRAQSASAPVTVVDGDATCQGAETACEDATALNGKLYSYAVFAVDRAGNTSPAGASAGVTARDQVAPAAPKGLVATPGDAIVDLRWTAAGADDDVAGYVLVAKPGSAAPATEADGTRVCTAIVAASTACTATGLTNGATYTFGLFALDEALNRSQAAAVGAVPNGRVTDAKAPAAVTRLKARVSGRAVTLSWKNPADRDFHHVVITSSERRPAARAAGKRVYSGRGTKATTKLAAGESRWFAVVAYDAAGNASATTSVRVTVAAPSRFGPAPRARVHGKVQLSWPVVKGARYYNVQLYAGKRRILVSWPARRALQLPRAKLKRGTTYTWYVWPGLGAKAKARYGKLIGKNSFTFMG